MDTTNASTCRPMPHVNEQMAKMMPPVLELVREAPVLFDLRDETTGMHLGDVYVSTPLPAESLAGCGLASKRDTYGDATIPFVGEHRKANKRYSGSVVSSVPLLEGRGLEKKANAGDGVDRSQWMAKVLRKHPEVLELRYQTAALSNSNPDEEVSLPYPRARTEASSSLDRDVILQLVMQHLSLAGFTQTIQMLEKESGIKSRPLTCVSLRESILHRVIPIALNDVDALLEEDGGDEADVDPDVIPALTMLPNIEVDAVLGPDDVHIWERAAEGENQVTYDEKGQVLAGTMNGLVIKLTDANPAPGYQNYLNTFLLTYRSFMTPEQLFSKLLQRYHVPRVYTAAQAQPVRLRVANVLKKWLQNHFIDFSEPLLIQVKHFAQNQLSKDEPQLSQSVLKTVDRNARGGIQKKQIQFDVPPKPPKVPKNIFSKSLSFGALDEEEIARQLTLITFEKYAAIRPHELLDQAWNKPKLKHRAPNVLEFIARANVISIWVVEMILSQRKLRDRAAMVKKFLRLAEQLKLLNNFATLMAVWAGLGHCAIYRLKHTFSLLSARELKIREEVGALLTSNGGYKTLRSHLQHNVTPPCIPFLGVYLTDLVFIEDGNMGTLANGLINFQKRVMVQEVISKIQLYQQNPYNLLAVPQIAELLGGLIKNHDEDISDALYERSKKLEPKDCEMADLE